MVKYKHVPSNTYKPANTEQASKACREWGIKLWRRRMRKKKSKREEDTNQQGNLHGMSAAGFKVLANRLSPPSTPKKKA